MTSSFSLSEFISGYIRTYRSNKLGADTKIRFSLYDVFVHQEDIIALWRECNKRHMRPVARTFLGRITEIALSPYQYQYQ